VTEPSTLELATRQMLAERFAVTHNRPKEAHAAWRALLYACGPDAALRMHEAGAEGRSTTWDLLLRAGIHPAEARRDCAIPGSSPWIAEKPENHPYFLASMFLRHGDTAAAQLILSEYALIKKERELILRGEYPTTFPRSWFSTYANSTFSRCFILTLDPQEYGIELQPYQAEFDRYGGLLWFREDSLTPLFEIAHSPTELERLTRALCVIDKRHLFQRIQKEALRLVYSYTQSKGRTQYISLVKVLRLCEPEGAELAYSYIMRRTAGKALQALFVCRPDVCSERMQQGLRALAGLGEDPFEEMLARLGRAPTVEELSFRSARVVEILHRMPFVLLQQTLHEGGEERLRAHLARFLGKADLEQVRNCLIDHPKRLTWVPPVTVEGAPGLDGVTPPPDGGWAGDWRVHADAIWEQFNQAKRLRAELLECCEGEWALAFAATLARSSDHAAPHLCAMAARYPRWAAARPIANRLLEAEGLL
jgi:hypothetical protein